MNRFHLGAVSGLITGVSANGVIFAFRNSHAQKQMFVTQMLVKWRTTTGFTAQQEVRLSVLPVTSFASANYTGGTDLSDYTGGSAVTATNAIKPRAKNRADQRTVLRSALETGNVRIATTGALNHGGAPTIATHPWMDEGTTELAAGDGVPTSIIDIGWEVNPFECSAGMVDYEGGWPIPSENGFIITLPIAMGAGGVGRLTVEMDWIES